MGYHIFLSYSRKDQDFALRLARDLKARSLPVWVDQWDIQPGAPWARSVEDALRTASHVLIVLSPDSVQSPNVGDEIAYAIDERKQLFPVLHRMCNIPMNLSPIQYVDFTQNYEQAIDKLADRLNRSAHTIPTGRGSSQQSPRQDNRDQHRAVYHVPGQHSPAVRREGPGVLQQSAQPAPSTPFMRSRTDRMLTGVCGGLAAYLGMSSTMVRLGLVVLSLFTSGIFVLIYLMLYLFMPLEPATT